MKLWKKLTSLLLAAAMMVPFAAAAPSEEGSFPDVDGHWAQAEIEQAVAAGWVDGYEDDTFRPERAVTRAEFVKMILDATHLTPGCETVEWMVENAKTRWGNYGTKEYEPRLNDMNDPLADHPGLDGGRPVLRHGGAQRLQQRQLPAAEAHRPV